MRHFAGLLRGTQSALGANRDTFQREINGMPEMTNVLSLNQKFKSGCGLQPRGNLHTGS